MPARSAGPRVRTAITLPLLASAVIGAFLLAPSAAVAPAGAQTVTTPPTFVNFAAPAGLGQYAGEPSIGVDWSTGNVMMEAALRRSA